MGFADGTATRVGGCGTEDGGKGQGARRVRRVSVPLGCPIDCAWGKASAIDKLSIRG